MRHNQNTANTASTAGLPSALGGASGSLTQHQSSISMMPVDMQLPLPFEPFKFQSKVAWSPLQCTATIFQITSRTEDKKPPPCVAPCLHEAAVSYFSSSPDNIPCFQEPLDRKAKARPLVSDLDVDPFFWPLPVFASVCIQGKNSSPHIRRDQMDFQKVALPELSPQQMPEPELEQLAEKQMDHS